MARDPELTAHLEWLGYIQPVGLVVSAPALLQAQAHVNNNVIPQHQRFLACLPVDKHDEVVPQIEDFPAFVRQVLDWTESDLVAFDEAAKSGIDGSGLEVVLPEYNETLRPTWIVPEFKSASAKSSLSTDSAATAATASAEPKQPSNADRFVMLIQQVPPDQDLDEPQEETDRRWHASPHARFERLLRETQVPAGLLINGRKLRLVYAPRGETSGYLTFNVDEMVSVAGRPMFAALHMLLNSDRLFNLEKKQRLPSILVESRKYQNIVSTQLAQQVMAAMYELLRGFQAADDQWNGKLLKDVLASNPQNVYHGLLTILMRSVFILYAEDRNLLSNHPVYTSYYSITGLFERLRTDAGQYPDTMDQRYGAWAQLLTLFRMIYEGGNHEDLKIPARKGYLFDPERYPFLEGGLGIEGLGLGKDVGIGEEYQHIAKNELVQERRPESAYNQPQTTNHQQQTTKHEEPTTKNSPLRTKHEEPTTKNAFIPRVSDGVIYRVLNNLLILDGERLSYRSLDVEQIGSVYEAIMGFEVKVATGRSIAIKPTKKHGAPATINLEELLATEKSKRAAWLSEQSDQDLTGKSLESLKSAATIEELLAALGNKIATEVTPNVAAAGAMIFQPSDERRRSGSHYTPRSLTEPIVRTTLEPILKQLCDPESPAPTLYSPTKEDKKRYTQGELDARIRLSERAMEHARRAREVGTPHPSQLLDLKVCDPAMGSGAFLVETCRQLGDELVKAWYAHDQVPLDIPPDEDELLYARRQIAQRCLYGVDKNVMAVDLAKLSLWLVTLAKDHAFTFLDHSLRAGDSLVGLTREQIIGFHWEPKLQKKFGEDQIQKRLDKATEARVKILSAREDVPYRDQEQRMAVADDALNLIRTVGDACVSAFFAGDKKKAREDRCQELYDISSEYLASLKSGTIDFAARDLLAQASDSLRHSEHPLSPFHWEIEFPEVFSRENCGFDAFVGNPPFLGGTRISEVAGMAYFQFLVTAFPPCEHHCDLVAYFLRRCFDQLRIGGCSGLLTTNTVSQGDTREGGLRTILGSSGQIFAARTRYRWPGQAAVIVSVIHVSKGLRIDRNFLDGRQVQRISAYLVNGNIDESPKRLTTNPYFSLGSKIYGQGFLFADDDPQCTPLKTRERILSAHPDWSDRMKPYLVGEEINSHPQQIPQRYVIYLSDIEDDEGLDEFPDLRDIVLEKVKPGRMLLGNNPNNTPLKKRWWAYQAHRPALYNTLQAMSHAICVSRVGQALAFARIPTDIVFSEAVVVLSLESFSAFAILQSRIHEIWARFFASSMKDDLRYTPSDCFETFPFPKDFETNHNLLNTGQRYYDFRANVLMKNEAGLTQTYNRFHDPHEKSSEILHLRELHDAMDRAVLEAYGWDDLAATARCEFLLDYEEEGTGDSGLGVGDLGDENQSLSASPKSRRKLPWRLRWPDDFRDEVLARLLELNEQRHKEELLAAGAPSAPKKVPKASAKKKTKKPTSDDQLQLGLDDE
ncbi:MAG: class I SAM-dependent DNA methyltransferase [Planctomycetota bacterium]|nr:class I SAM-dependent DNA methyltransferase [Planctomycetota bacterium]